MQIFHSWGLFGIFRWAHVISAVMWMGLLWFFNLIQTPAYAEMDPGARNQAFDKLTWRTLWWFRWAAAATVASAPSGSVTPAAGATSAAGRACCPSRASRRPG